MLPRAFAVKRCVPMLSDHDAAEAALTMAITRTEASRAIILRAAAIMPQLEQRQADELRNEVKSCMNELIPHLIDAIAEVSTLVAMRRMPHRYLCEEFAKLAKIQDSKRHQFDEHIAKALTRWFCGVIFFSGSGSAAPIFGAMKRNLTDVHEKLAEPSGVWWRISFEREETDPSVADMFDDVMKLVAVIERTMARGHDRGAPAGVRQYPELDTLVFHLELGAQLSDGKFTVQKKPVGKGTIIEALNLLRYVVRTNIVTGEKLAAAIPLPDQHPISTYARTINDARKAAAAKTRN
jgi:hypothetical protein